MDVRLKRSGMTITWVGYLIGNPKLTLKPVEQTPLIALKLVEVLYEINELPHGVVNIVTGDALTTGSTEVDK